MIEVKFCCFEKKSVFVNIYCLKNFFIGKCFLIVELVNEGGEGIVCYLVFDFFGSDLYYLEG